MDTGNTNPETRLTAINTKPSASSPRLGLIKAQTSGRFFHAFLRFTFLAGDFASVSVAMDGEAKQAFGNWMRANAEQLHQNEQ
jgi:hypothetical protein